MVGAWGLRFANRARLQCCVNRAAFQIGFVHFLHGRILSVGSFAVLASVSACKNVPVFYDNRSNARMKSAIVLSDTLLSYDDCFLAEYPIQGGLNECHSFFCQLNIYKKFIWYGRVLRPCEMPTH